MAGPRLQDLYNYDDDMALTHACLHWSARDSHLCAGLPPAASVVFNIIVLCAGLTKQEDDWTAQIDYERMHRLTGLSRAHCMRMVGLLERHEIVLRKRDVDNCGNISNIYTLPARRMWTEGRITYEAEEQIIKERRESRREKLIAFHKLNKLSTLPADDPKADEQDLPIEDAEADAQTTADEVEDVTAAIVDDPTHGEKVENTQLRPMSASEEANKLARQLLGLAGWADPRRDDLNTAGQQFFNLLRSEGRQAYRTIGDCVVWTMSEEKFWGPKLREAGNPAAFFCKSYPTIQKQAAGYLRKKAERRDGPTQSFSAR